MRVLAVIPAKGDSRRLPGKNLCVVNGRTLIELAVDYAKTSQYVTDIVVSTDSECVASLVNSKKLCPVIMRPDDMGDVDVVEVYCHAINVVKEQGGDEVDVVVGIQPDHPGRSLRLDDSIDYFNSTDAYALITVGRNGERNGALQIFNARGLTFPGKIVTAMDSCINIHTKSDLERAQLQFGRLE
jgi:CMP-N,N'-diacetyllegionaminic acid synthase